MPLIIFILAVAFFSIHIVLTKKRMSSHHKMELLLTYLFGFLVGVQSFLSFIAHIFYPTQTADLIGWAPGSPFQFEVGIANLSFAALGFFATIIKRRFWLAVLIGYTVWLWGDAIGHIIQYILKKDTAIGNIGIYFFSDLVAPALLILTYLFYIRTETTAATWKGKLDHILNQKD